MHANDDVQARPAGYYEALRADVRAGLTATPKTLPPKYFYDERGSELFDEITRLPEYYLTRAETAILEQRAAEIASLSPCQGVRTATFHAFNPSTLQPIPPKTARNQIKHILNERGEDTKTAVHYLLGDSAAYAHCLIFPHGVRLSTVGVRWI